MNGEERRRGILNALGQAPLSATKISEKFGVSRQVIVQDIALLRAGGHPVIATNRGYILSEKRCERVFKVPAHRRRDGRRTSSHRRRGRDGGGRIRQSQSLRPHQRGYARAFARAGRGNDGKTEKRQIHAAQTHHFRLSLSHGQRRQRSGARRHRRESPRARFSHTQSLKSGGKAQNRKVRKNLAATSAISLTFAPPCNIIIKNNS